MDDTIDGHYSKPPKVKRKKSMVATLKTLFKRHVLPSGSPDIQPADDEDSVSPIASFMRAGSQDSSILLKRKHDDAWMQAVYNSLALVYVLIIGLVLVAVYYVLEPFLHALLWAVLVGMVLHPFKHACTSKITESLQYAQKHHLPLTLTLLLTPFSLVNWLAVSLEEFVKLYWKTITFIVASEVLVLSVYWLGVPHQLGEMDFNWHYIVPYYESLGAPFLVSVVTLSVGVVTVSLCNNKLGRVLSSFFWLLIFLVVSYEFFGTLAMPLVVLLYLVATLVVLFRKKKTAPEGTDLSKVLPGNSEASMKTDGTSHSELMDLDSEREANKKEKILKDVGEKGKGDTVRFDLSANENDAPSKLVSCDDHFQSSSKTSLESMDKESSSAVQSSHHGEGAPDGGANSLKKSRLRSSQKSELAQRARQSNNYWFVVLIISSFFVCVWKYPLFKVFLLFLTLVFLWSFAYPRLSPRLRGFWCEVSSRLARKKEVFFPPPVRVFGQVLLSVDQVVLSGVIQWVGVIVTALIVLGLFVVVLVASVMLLLQIQVEVGLYLAEGAVLWNRTVAANPDWVQWAKGMGIEGNSLETAAQYFRDYIKNQLHTLLVESADRVKEVDLVMKAVDNLYAKYFFIEEPVASQGFFYRSTTASPSSLTELFSENLGTIVSLVQSLGAVVTANVSVALSLFHALLHVVFSGSTVLVNIIVFVTALFYLLDLSDKSYLPVQWVIELVPQLNQEEDGGSKQGEPFQRAIKSVFYTSFRRAGFYSLYIWLTHTVMGVSATILPSVLGGLAAAVPLVNPGLVSVLAVLELWFIKGEIFLAVAMVLLILLPEMYMYSVINEEIVGAHPYLTGLAIAGGIYFAGLEGALIGPILLCCLLCFVDIYEDIFNN